jgi:hypothetical protein
MALLTDRYAANRAVLALSMAGEALDAALPKGPQPELATVLLKESVIWAARAFDPAIATYDGALASLEGTGLLASHAAAAMAKVSLSELDATSLEPSTLVEAKRSVEEVVLRAVTPRRRWSAGTMVRLGFVLAVAAAVVAIVASTGLYPWKRYSFRASSAYQGFHQTGDLGDAKIRGLVLHTNEESQPWVEINLLATRSIHSVVLKNREDCCKSRGIPLVVEVATETDGWRTVGRRDTVFDNWRADFAPMNARRVRIRSLGTTVLQLSEIQIL